jgi:hypothetical protein
MIWCHIWGCKARVLASDAIRLGWRIFKVFSNLPGGEYFCPAHVDRGERIEREVEKIQSMGWF